MNTARQLKPVTVATCETSVPVQKPVELSSATADKMTLI